MRIGILAPPWLPVPPPAYGGTEAVVDGLARGLLAAGHDVLLWTVGDSTCPVPRAHVYAHARTEAMGSAAVEIRHVAAGYGAFAIWGADVVHDHTTVGPLVAMVEARVPVVSTNHGPFDPEALALYRAVHGRIAVVAISHDQARRATGIPVAATIHHGLDIDRWTFGRGGGDGEGDYVAFLGRMAPDKGVHLAIEAARRAGCRLLIAAKMRRHDEHEYFASAVAPRLGADVRYLGELDLDAKATLLREARALLNPIRWPEPFGLAMIESLACGTPVLAFQAGSATELIDHGRTGFLCADVDDMATRLGQVERIDREACRHSALTNFSFERMVREHLVLYGSLVRKGPRPTPALAGDPV
jgi:glycosyltransferase involved in cell wall biosynthesis